jgi:hypothetical protein
MSPVKQGADFARSNCAVASTLDVIGDKWSLLVIRDLFAGKSTYGELLASGERMPTNILADLLVAISLGAIGGFLLSDRPVTTAPMATLPLVLSPAFMVPIFILMHLAMLAQAKRAS